MRFIHTSDWHLGRSFHRVGLLDAQALYLDHLVEVVRSEGVDAVLVSGDVYDRALPAPDSVDLLSDAVTRLIDAGAVVVLSSGNHDSAIRLGFASDLLARAGLHIRTSLDSVGMPVMIKDVDVYPVPYLEPSVAADPMGAQERTHAAVLRAAMDRVHTRALSRPGCAVVMAHAFVTGGATSDSERDISVGGVCAVHPDVFAQADYVALGHLHGPQRITETVRYSGSPLALSFSETDQNKGSVLVDVSPGVLNALSIPAPVTRSLAVLRGDLEDLLRDPRHRGAESAYCKITLTDTMRPMGAMERLRRRFPNTLVLAFEPLGAQVTARTGASSLRQRGDLDLCCDFLAHVRGGSAASAQERGLLATAIEGSRVARSDHDDEGRARGTGSAA
ncbi:MAG: exonuclease SbcCD subunit D [Actinomycetota bacterium]